MDRISYLKDNQVYLFLGADSLDRDVFHVWSNGEPYTAHRHSSWAEQSGNPDLCSGTQVPAAAMDRFVMMRFAELVAAGRASALLAAMISEDVQGSGAWQLRGNAAAILDAVARLQTACRLYTHDDLPADLGGA